jgi:hypothetical protein
MNLGLHIPPRVCAVTESRPPWTSGFRILLLGGVLMIGLLIYLQPITDRTGCPNYGGNGNASAFADERWDAYFILGVPVWLVLISIEQLLPPTWRARSGAAVAARAIAALFAAVLGSCVILSPFLIMCR